MNDLQLFSKYYIAYSNLSESDCDTLLNFVDEASDNQLEHLLQTGEMVKEENVNEAAGVSIIQVLKGSTELHLKVISELGFGAWLKSLPGAIDAVWKLSSTFLGAKTGIKITAAYAAAS